MIRVEKQSAPTVSTHRGKNGKGVDWVQVEAFDEKWLLTTREALALADNLVDSVEQIEAKPNSRVRIEVSH